MIWESLTKSFSRYHGLFTQLYHFENHWREMIYWNWNEGIFRDSFWEALTKSFTRNVELFAQWYHFGNHWREIIHWNWNKGGSKYIFRGNFWEPPIKSFLRNLPTFLSIASFWKPWSNKYDWNWNSYTIWAHLRTPDLYIFNFSSNFSSNLHRFGNHWRGIFH